MRVEVVIELGDVLVLEQGPPDAEGSSFRQWWGRPMKVISVYENSLGLRIIDDGEYLELSRYTVTRFARPETLPDLTDWSLV